MKKIFFRFFYRFGFIHETTIEPIFTALKLKISTLEEKSKNQNSELSSLNNKVSEFKKLGSPSSLKKEIKELESTLKRTKQKLSTYEEKEFSLKEDKQKMHIWSKKVKEIADYSCDICKRRENQIPLTSHHLYPRSIHPTLMYNPDNGVCLCEICHVEFHKKYPDVNQITHKTYEKFKQIKLILLKY